MKSTYLVVQTHRAGVVAHNQVAAGLELQRVRPYIRSITRSERMSRTHQERQIACGVTAKDRSESLKSCLYRLVTAYRSHFHHSFSCRTQKTHRNSKGKCDNKMLKMSTSFLLSGGGPEPSPLPLESASGGA